jgi:hypothetical protein
LQHCRQVLLEMVDLGRELAGIVVAQAKSQPDNPEAAHQAITDYDTVTRSLRRTVMLHDKLAKPGKSLAHRKAARKKIIREVEDAIQREASDDEQEILRAEFLERLDSPDLEDEIADRSVADIVTDITRDLGIAGLYDTHPWKRRIPHDIAILNARAEQVSGGAPSAELAALLASAPPPPPRPRHRGRYTPLTQAQVSKMSDEEIEARLQQLNHLRES